ncbi:hypothetical protein NEIFL0001_1347 [Neisseria flavescens SK114]|nr:hypothetical protein NEIFL0001_1347 [Neisseria flavescens SK114]
MPDFGGERSSETYLGVVVFMFFFWVFVSCVFLCCHLFQTTFS